MCVSRSPPFVPTSSLACLLTFCARSSKDCLLCCHDRRSTQRLSVVAMFSGDEWLHVPTHEPIALDRPTQGRRLSRVCIGLLGLSALVGSALLLAPTHIRTARASDAVRGWAVRLDSFVRGAQHSVGPVPFAVGDLYRPGLPAEIDIALRGASSCDRRR